MKFSLLVAILSSFLVQCSVSQKADPLNTAAQASYLSVTEKEMIREINLLRSDPKGYLVYVDEYVRATEKMPEVIGKGQKNYSLTMYYETVNGVDRLVKVDTVWLDAPESEQEAIASLRKDLASAKPLSILMPDAGLYEAAKKHAQDQDRHEWSLWHVGSDGSMPWDRIKKYSPEMTDGNENIAARNPQGTARQIVIQLLIDTGIPGYGHRYNLLDPRWTHVACYDAGLHVGLYRWMQVFGQML
jgi:uncharacterized protein YkwD